MMQSFVSQEGGGHSSPNVLSQTQPQLCGGSAFLDPGYHVNWECYWSLEARVTPKFGQT